MTDHADTTLPDPEREACLATLSKILDGRSVPADQAAAAQARLAQDPECAAIWADFQAQQRSLAAEPTLTARAGFADRVHLARGQEQLGTLAFVRRLALAASVAMVLTAGYGLARPGVLVADPGVERERHHVDVLKTSPYATPDLEGGLERLLRDSDPHHRRSP